MSDGINFTFPANTILAPGECLLLVRDLAAFDAHHTNIPAGVQKFQWTSGSLDNGGEKVELSMPCDKEWQKDRFYIRVDRLNYEDEYPWPTTPDALGDSLHRIVDTAYGNDPANFQAAPPTPGQ